MIVYGGTYRICLTPRGPVVMNLLTGKCYKTMPYRDCKNLIASLLGLQPHDLKRAAIDVGENMPVVNVNPN